MGMREADSSGASSSTPLFQKKIGVKRDVRARETGTTASQSNASETSTNDAGTAWVGQEDDEPSSSVVLLKKRRVGRLHPSLLQSATLSRRIKGRRDEDGDGEEDNVLVDTVSGLGHRGSTPSGLGTRDDATRTSTWHDEVTNVAHTKGRSIDEEDPPAITNDDGLYRGSAAYSTFLTQHDDGISAKIKGTVKGPMKASNNVRTITMVDYQPDVCKDYKQTGYCGFGDTCKFLHDRSDYLAGWQVDALPNSSTSRRRGGTDDEGVGSSEVEEEIPFACLICRKPFADPVVTKCGHYFCSACAIKRFAKSSKCFACGKQTQGIFNAAQKVLDRMEKVRAAKQDERDQQRWDRDDDDDGKVQDQVGGELLEGVEVG